MSISVFDRLNPIKKMFKHIFRNVFIYQRQLRIFDILSCHPRQKQCIKGKTKTIHGKYYVLE